jgi:streptogramin lyase
MNPMRGKQGWLVALSCAVACGDSGSRDDAGEEGSFTITISGGTGTSMGGEHGESNDDNTDKLDSGMLSDLKTGGGDCPGGGGMHGDFDFSFIWIANSPQNTISKIDTLTGVEVGRYVSGPASQADPSRTSVNLNGDVAVANRGASGSGAGGVTKIAAKEDDCIDRNGNGTIETSTGSGDVLPWDEDECVLWNVPIDSSDHRRGPRPIAWEGLAEGCVAMNPRLWVGWYDRDNNLGKFQRLDGDTGAVLDQVDVPNWSNGLEWGPYGGAVDKEGDFWVLGWQQGPLIEIDGETLEVRRYDFPTPPGDQRWSYGIALDQHGNPWIASAGSAATFDVETETWSFITTGNQSMRGLMIDSEDRAWFAVDRIDPFGGCGLGLIDVSTHEVVSSAIPLEGCSTPVGISIDVEGFVWVVDQGANAAFKVNPESYQVELSVGGLSQPYTYSDMTGAGLQLVVLPPA